MTNSMGPTEHQKQFYTQQREQLQDQVGNHYNRGAADMLAHIYEKMQPTAKGERAGLISEAIPYLHDVSKSGYGIAELNKNLTHPLINTLMQALPEGKLAEAGRLLSSVPKAVGEVGAVGKEMIPQIGQDGMEMYGTLMNMIERIKGTKGIVKASAKKAAPKSLGPLKSAEKVTIKDTSKASSLKPLKASEKVTIKNTSKASNLKPLKSSEKVTVKNTSKKASDLPDLKKADKVKGVREKSTVRNKSKKGTDGRVKSRKSKE